MNEIVIGIIQKGILNIVKISKGGSVSEHFDAEFQKNLHTDQILIYVAVSCCYYFCKFRRREKIIHE